MCSHHCTGDNFPSVSVSANENKDNVSIGEMVRFCKGWEVFLNRPQIN